MLKIILLSLAFVAYGQKPSTSQFPEIDKLNSFRSKTTNSNRYAIREFQKDLTIQGASFEEKAKNYLLNKLSFSLMKNASVYDFKLIKVQKNHGGAHVRYEQLINGIPVHESESVISFNKKGNISMAFSSFKDLPFEETMKAVLSDAEAIQKSNIYLNDEEIFNKAVEKSTLKYLEINGSLKLVRIVNIAQSGKRYSGDFQFFISASSGEILQAKDIAIYYKSDKTKKKAKKKANGQGRVFDPDPLSSAKKNYGATGFTDSSDSDLDSLNAHTKLVTLRDLTLENGTYHLKNEFVQLSDHESPSDNFVTLADPNTFDFTRADQRFEHVNVFHHMNESVQYIKSLGFDDVEPSTYSGGIKVDPHGVNGDDNSHYRPSSEDLAWGEGGVDDAEDVDVILHEYGHAIKDFTMGGQGQEGMGEGFGDYWAESYSRAISNWSTGDSQYKYVFSWDGHNEFWGGRLTEYNKSYPEDLINQVHSDGGIWVTPLMRIYERVGREDTDKLVLKSHYYLNSSADQTDAALAVLQASNDLFSGDYNAIIKEEFLRVGQMVYANPVAAITIPSIEDTLGLADTKVYFLSISNIGVGFLKVVPTEASDVFDFSLDTISLYSAEGSSFRITLNPELVIGDYEGELLFWTNDSNLDSIKVPYNIQVRGSRLKYNSTSINSTYLQNVERYIEVAISNTGYNELTLSQTNFGTVVNMSDENITIQRNESKNVKFYFSMNQSLGTKTGNIDIETNDVNLTNFSIPYSITYITVDDFAVDYSIQYPVDIALSKYLSIYIKSSIENGRTPLVKVTSNGSTSSISSSSFDTDSKLYRFNYILGDSAAVVFDIENFDQYDNSAFTSLEFLYFLNVEENATKQIDAFTRIQIPKNSNFFAEIKENPSQETISNMRQISKTYDIQYRNNLSNKEKALKMTYSDIEFDHYKVGLYRFNNDLKSWDYIGGEGSANSIETSIKENGQYALFYNEEHIALPTEYDLKQNYPNPFNPSTIIPFDLAENQHLTLDIYNILGQHIIQLVNKELPQNRYEFKWNGTNSRGIKVPSGVYFYKIQAGSKTFTRKMMLIK